MINQAAVVRPSAGMLSTEGSSTWDLLVIGGGTAGIVAAKTAAGFGASVLLVERDRTGGECLWTGCVPSKALLAAAVAVADARRAGRGGSDGSPSVPEWFARQIGFPGSAVVRS